MWRWWDRRGHTATPERSNFSSMVTPCEDSFYATDLRGYAIFLETTILPMDRGIAEADRLAREELDVMGHALGRKSLPFDVPPLDESERQYQRELLERKLDWLNLELSRLLEITPPADVASVHQAMIETTRIMRDACLAKVVMLRRGKLNETAWARQVHTAAEAAERKTQAINVLTVALRSARARGTP